MTLITNFKKLYQTDDYQWLLETITLLKNKQFNNLDIDNLIEELEDMGSEKRNAVKSLLEQIIRHFLLLQYWNNEYERNRHHWEAEIISFRNQIEDRLTTNLRNYIENEKEKIYQRALKYIQRKTNNKLELPKFCPYSLEELLNEDYFPHP